MYAVVLTGGKQYRVQEGDVIFVEKLNAEVESTVELTEVLAVSNGETLTVGAPKFGAKVAAKVAAQGKLRKSCFKHKPKKDYRKKTGHRQPYTKLVIEKSKLNLVMVKIIIFKKKHISLGFKIEGHVIKRRNWKYHRWCIWYDL